jgi:polysaccharide export outer membrane protein
MRNLVCLVSVLALCGCAALPVDGPSAGAVEKSARHESEKFALVDLSYKVTQDIATQPSMALAGLAQFSSNAPVDLIGVGDALSVSVFEAGAGGLFARPAELASGSTPQTFPRLIVDDHGMLTIPFAGDIPIAGLTPKDAAERIRLALHGRAADPQVTVTLLESNANMVDVIGEVRNPRRFGLAANNDRLLDIIASAGGPTRLPGDIDVVVVRGTHSAETSYSQLLRDPAQNIRLAPHDQVRLLYKPRKYSTFGALPRDAQVPLEDDVVTLAAAISRAGGLDPNNANGTSVLVFRFERPEVAAALGVHTPPTPKGVPILYRLDLSKADGYFIANTFEMEPDDLVYVPRAGIPRAQQFVGFVNAVAGIAYNARVTSVLP